jgi:hypothetical protein
MSKPYNSYHCVTHVFHFVFQFQPTKQSRYPNSQETQEPCEQYADLTGCMVMKIRHNLLAPGWMTDELRFDSHQRQHTLVSFKTSRTILGAHIAHFNGTGASYS